MYDELLHFGILGMRWGVRRKPGPDGTVGEKSKSDGKTESKDSSEAKRLRTRSMSELSNDELRALNNRLQLERQYSELTKSNISKGKAFALKLLEDVGKDVVREVVKDLVKDPAKNAVKSLITDKVLKRK